MFGKDGRKTFIASGATDATMTSVTNRGGAGRAFPVAMDVPENFRLNGERECRFG
jgi:hypothetical protein